jgi:6-phosphofructokinase 1
MMVDFLLDKKIDILFCIGGDGTQKGALAISDESKKRGAKISVIGVPKTIDNDICYIERTFGFETAVALAQSAIRAAHEESRSVRYGVGIVKLMGRDSGFIALDAALASGDVNLLLIPGTFKKPIVI